MFRTILRTFSTRKYNKVGLIGVPFEKGQQKKGVALGPKVIRDAGLTKELEVLGLDVKDYGDIIYKTVGTGDINNMTHLEDVAACTKLLSEQVQKILKDDRCVLTLGGDHSVSVGTIDGHVQAMEDIAVLWIDAHADLNTNKTSESGNVHGMPVALLTTELSDYWPHLPGMDWQKPMLSIRNVAYIGLRSVDRYERLVIEKFGIPAFGMEDVERFGIHNTISMALDKIDPYGVKSLHVSFDIDSLDPLEAPSTGTAVRGGLSLREAIHIMEEIHRTRRLNAIDLVEVNPHIGDQRDVKLTVEAAIFIIQAALGYTRRGLKVPKGVTDMPLQTFK
ncbi:PREDICTED: arginase-2, mitochondrial isoform X2 [Polistes canadensis]|uniref:arginase-2, mitochondrial isoform X2 n=1 Tax=Polistes canadensis TaxID=91411 RepID=UPI000718FEC2|nr:PREDICTED: arginase-2, mitochondrial isoform X2 [Polistes canadensis]